jgi:hypothetical protein
VGGRCSHITIKKLQSYNNFLDEKMAGRLLLCGEEHSKNFCVGKFSHIGEERENRISPGGNTMIRTVSHFNMRNESGDFHLVLPAAFANQLGAEVVLIVDDSIPAAILVPAGVDTTITMEVS